MAVNTDVQNQEILGEQLSIYLADTYTLYLKTQNYHWNVKGIHFRSHHLLFEEHYQALAEAIDELAERIRSLGERAPGSFKEYQKLATLQEATGAEESEDMIHELTRDHEALARSGKELIEKAEQRNDPVTADLITTRVDFHETTAWMLRSHLE